MHFRLIILILSLVQYNINFIDCIISHTPYLSYLINVVEHMCIQKGWQSMENLYINLDSDKKFSGTDIMAQQVDCDNLKSIFCNIIHFLNYRYNEVLLIFVELISIVIDICENFLNAKLLYDFYNSTKLLVNEVKNSLTMFENLYNAMTFISYIDLKFVILESQSNLFTIVDDIYEIKNHMYFKKIQNEFLYVDLEVFLETKKFIDDISKIAKNFLQNNTFITNTVDKIDFKSKIESEYWANNTDYTNFIFFIYHKINLFYTETIKINYEGLGFIQLINPTHQKFKPPIDKSINQKLGIMTLNTLFNEGSWSSFSHIKIQYGDLKISAESVIRDQVTDHNIYLKKHYFTHLVRCRFYEVLLVYNTSLTVLNGWCRRDKKKKKDYLKCVTCLFDVINGTVKMFDYMMTIIEKIKLSTIWPNEKLFSNLISTHKLIYNYVIDLKANNVIRDYFVNKPKEDTEKIANDYIISFQNVRCHFINGLRNLKRPQMNHCHSEAVMLTKENLEIEFLNYVHTANKAMSNDTRITRYDLILKYLCEFCENFIKTDYENTGFNKIYQNYFWQWA
ncbi:uncharacterized protein LOC126907740 [Daktulosphaira vitifoliae]|uniref:uncharacterized protein LOC126907740 n=1 Tax=Daktulosphaira vitifoliae TaxID=58002 RepID=UPI0021AAEABD|nr:uncharacterized protein LOC126907740 [Daktulosphaira vitifoliae]